MKRILKTMKINSKIELIQKVNEIWEAFPQSSINSLILSFHGRLRMVIADNGQSISDKLRSGIHKAPQIVLPYRNDLLGFNDLVCLNDPDVDDQPVEFTSKRKFNNDEDILLLSLVDIHGRKWKLLSEFFVDRTPNSLKNRYNYIRNCKIYQENCMCILHVLSIIVIISLFVKDGGLLSGRVGFKDLKC